MYEEDKIFGPLTLKQFLVVALGVLVSYGAYTSLPQNTAYGVIAFVALAVIYVAFVRFAPKKIPLADFEKYLENKRYEIGPNKYLRMLQKKQAEVESMMSLRRAHNLPLDTKTIQVSAILANLIQKAKNEGLK